VNDQKARVLVVDDEAAVREVTARILRKQDYEVETAADAAAALELLARQGFALALVDIRMPGDSGLELLDEVQRSFPAVAVVMTTAVSDVHTAVDCLRRGASDYLVKPVATEVLEIMVERALQKRQMRLELEGYREHLEKTVEEQTRRVRHLYLGTIQALALSLEAKDPYTRGHSERVATLAREVARRLGLGEGDLRLVEVAGRLHDIGKIGIEEALLHKPGPLTAKEFEEVKQHPSLGAHILKPIAADNRLSEAVLHHHENWDGSGYPLHLVGADIPLLARILRVCDLYEALASNRSYRSARTKEEARAMVEEESGRALDPGIAKVFFSLLEDGSFRDAGLWVPVGQLTDTARSHPGNREPLDPSADGLGTLSPWTGSGPPPPPR
jgi:putative nucleotidyltransferase with HDIG domain